MSVTRDTSALDLIRETTPFEDEVVCKWLLKYRALDTPTNSIDHIPDAYLYDFLVNGLRASPGALGDASRALLTKRSLSVTGDAWGFTDPRAHGKVRLAFDLPFSMHAYNDPESPFYRVGYMHKDYIGWWPCSCWKCT